MASSKWLQGCEICNAGLINRVDELVAGGISVRKACKLMAEEGERKIGDMVYSQAAISARYRQHKGLINRKRDKVSGNHKPTSQQTQSEQQQDKKEESVIECSVCGEMYDSSKWDLSMSGECPYCWQKNNIIEQPQMEDVEPEPHELSSKHNREAAKASANAKKPKPSELEKAEKIIVMAARKLEAIVEGRIKDNGSEYDKLSAESIKRHGPSFIISYYQLGIDPQKAVNFYKGEKTHNETTHIEGDL